MELSHTFEYLQPAVAFELIGVSSLSKPEILAEPEALDNPDEIPCSRQESPTLQPKPEGRATKSPSKMDLMELHMHEEYIYVFRPIPPPGFVAMGVVCSTTPTFDNTVYCVSERIVHYSKKAQELGEIFGQQTANFISDYE